MYPVLVHELIHSFSPKTSLRRIRQAYQETPGLEEGVVEMLQRLVGPKALNASGLKGFSDNYAYNNYIDALEEMRSKLSLTAIGNMSQEDFYLKLFQVPHERRADYLLGGFREISDGDENEYPRFLRRMSRYGK